MILGFHSDGFQKGFSVNAICILYIYYTYRHTNFEAVGAGVFTFYLVRKVKLKLESCPNSIIKLYLHCLLSLYALF